MAVRGQIPLFSLFACLVIAKRDSSFRNFSNDFITDCAFKFPCAADIEGDCNVQLKLSVCFKTFEANEQQKKKENVYI